MSQMRARGTSIASQTFYGNNVGGCTVMYALAQRNHYGKKGRRRKHTCARSSARLSVDFSIKISQPYGRPGEADELCCGMGGKSRRVRCVYEKRKIQL